MLCNSVVSVIAGIVVLMLEDVAVVSVIVFVVFSTVKGLVVNGTVDELLGLSVIGECALVMLSVAPPVTVVKFVAEDNAYAEMAG